MKKIITAILCSLCILSNALLTSVLANIDRQEVVQTNPLRPNIVFILADDLDSTTSPFWDAMPQTAALLRDRGVNFTNAFAPTPICCPARSSILTGKYGHNTGVLTNGGDQGGWETFVRNGNEERTAAVYLKNAGYKTALIGKYLNGIENNPTYVPPGWSEWNAFVDNISYTGYNYQINENGTVVQYGNNQNDTAGTYQGTYNGDYATDVVGRKAVDFIYRAEANDAQPFFLYTTPTAPHLPLPPAPRHADNPYTNSLAPRKPNYNEADISDKPLWLTSSGDLRSTIVNSWNDRDYRNRMGSLYALDEMIAAIYKSLEANGELNNTIFVFTSDNGYNLGAHRLIHKMAPYEESIKVPLVISGAGITTRTENRITLEIDFAPTFLQLAGLSVPSDTNTLDYMDGRSLAPLLRGQQPGNWRNDLLLQYVTGGAANGIGAELPPGFNVLVTGQEIPTYKAVRTPNYTYVEWYDDERFTNFQDAELYDLGSDPFQLNNLLSTLQGRLQNRNLVNQLKSRMNQLITCKGATCQ